MNGERIRNRGVGTRFAEFQAVDDFEDASSRGRALVFGAHDTSAVDATIAFDRELDIHLALLCRSTATCAHVGERRTNDGLDFVFRELIATGRFCGRFRFGFFRSGLRIGFLCSGLRIGFLRWGRSRNFCFVFGLGLLRCGFRISFRFAFIRNYFFAIVGYFITIVGFFIAIVGFLVGFVDLGIGFVDLGIGFVGFCLGLSIFLIVFFGVVGS